MGYERTVVISETPLSVLVQRHPNVESAHHVDIVIAQKSNIVSAWGDPDRKIMSRSAIKPIQALPLIRSGARSAFELEPHHVALACASHSGEPKHLEEVELWLSKIGGSTDWLECGATSPISQSEAIALGPDYERIHNCCSGKHTGFLSIAAHLDVDPAGYISADHPIQQMITNAVEVFTGYSLENVKPGIDGCGIPTHPIPLQNVAMAMARLVDPSEIDPSWHDACTQVVEALDAHPWWESGTGRHEMKLHADKTEPLVCKTGAEGVFTAALPQRGIGIACKARDGAMRASDAAITWALAHLGAIEPDASKLTITNAEGNAVGDVSVETPADI